MNRGCQQRRLELYLSNDLLANISFTNNVCKDSCSVRTKEWNKILPFWWDAIVAWFESGGVHDSSPMKLQSTTFSNFGGARRNESRPSLI